MTTENDGLTAICPFQPGAVLWYVIGQPGYDAIPHLVLSVSGANMTVYDPLFDMVAHVVWHPPTGHSIGDCGLLRKSSLPAYHLDKIRDFSQKRGLTLLFKSDE